MSLPSEEQKTKETILNYGIDNLKSNDTPQNPREIIVYWYTHKYDLVPQIRNYNIK